MGLKAAPDDQRLLLDLQALDTKLGQIDHKAKSLPQIAELAGLSSEVATARQAVATAQGAAEDVRIELGRLESDVDLVEKRIARDTARLETTSSVKDVQALEQELAALRKRRDDLEEIELAVMERQEGFESDLATVQGTLDGFTGRQRDLETSRDEALVELRNERTHIAANRSTIAAKIPADLLDLYERQRGRYGWGASLLQYGSSMANGVKLQENDLASIRAAAPDDVIICPVSDAILVRTAESGL